MGRRSVFQWVLTVLGLVFIGLAIITLGHDAQMTAAAGSPDFKPIGEWWYQLHRGSYGGVQVFLERYVWPAWLGIWIWETVILNVVQWPAWLPTMPLGILLFIFGRSS